MGLLKTKIKSFIKRSIKVLRINKFIYAISSPCCSRKVDGAVEESKTLLANFSPRPIGTSIAKNIITDFQYDLQIIIPAYNVEGYIEECINSILDQKTRYTYKIIVIDDGSTDSTKDLVDKYRCDKRIQIIHQDNRGLSGARNRGMEIIKAKYIAFIDSDDKLMPGAIDALLNAAIKYDVDIAEGGFYRLTGDKLTIGYKHTRVKKVNAVKDLKGFSCGKVFKSSLFSNIQFPENFWFEDSIGVFLLYPRALKAVIIPNIVYVYRQNLTGISHTAPLKSKCVDSYWVVEQLLQDRKALKMEPTIFDYENYFKQIILNYKRTKKMPDEIQKSIFICSVDLMKGYFKDCPIPKYFKGFEKALQSYDFGKYKRFCDLFIF